MSVEHLLLATGGVLYGGAVLWLLMGLRRGSRPSSSARPPVSIIVCARDEEENIDSCLDALCAQDYPGVWEVIVVDDRSRDGTAGKVVRWGRDHARVRLVRAPDPPRYICPKKSALACGIERARGELVLLTDADCRPAPGWARKMVACFTAEVGLVAGSVRPDRGSTWRQRLLCLDHVAMRALAAGSFGMGVPLSCTGRNLAYRRIAYEQVGGFEAIGHLVSGDDVYLMRLLAERTEWRLVYQPEEEAVVACAAPPRAWGDILHQKLRHAAKMWRYRGPGLLLGAGAYGFHAVLAWSGLKILAGFWDPLAAAVWAAKLGLDGILLSVAAPSAERRLLGMLPVLEIVYVPYVLVFTVLGRIGWFRWKR